MWHKTIYFCAFTVLMTECARILVVCPTPSFSHQIFCRTIYKQLAIKGHEIVAFTTEPFNNRSLKTLKEVNLKHLYNRSQQMNFGKLLTDMYRIEIIYKIQNSLGDDVDEIFSHRIMKKLIQNKDQHFDLVIIEWCVNPSLAILSRRFNAPLIGLRSLGLRLEGHDSIANPTNPSYIPVAYMDFEKTFWGRLDNFLFSIMWRLQHYFFTVPQAKYIAKKHFPEISDDISDIEKNVSIILTNTHPVLNGARPLVPSIIEVGGIHLRKDEDIMTQDLANYLNDATNGVVYFNLGNHVRSSNLSENLLKVLFGALTKVPYSVLWKWETENLPRSVNNIKMIKWLPQQKVLAHPNVKVFITHGGLSSFEEAIEYHVPLIGIPFFADQHTNVRRMVYLGIGKYLDMRTVTEEQLVTVIKDVANNDTYKKNIIKVSMLLKDRNIEPLDKAIWWIEYVLRNKGAPYFKTMAVDMNWVEYLMLDLVTFIVFCIFIIYTIIYYTFLCISFFRNKNYVKTEVKKE